MTKREALLLLLDWQKRHDKNDLFVGKTPTDIGRKAIEDFRKLKLSVTRKAIAETEIKDPFPALAGVFKRAKSMPGGLERPDWIGQMQHGQVVRCVNHQNTYGCIETRRGQESICWFVTHSSISFYPYWAVQTADDMKANAFQPVEEPEAAMQVSAWSDNIERGAYKGEIPECVLAAIARRQVNPGTVVDESAVPF